MSGLSSELEKYLKLEKTNTNWIVDNDHMPIRVCDYDEKYAVHMTASGPIPGMPHLRRQFKREFATEREAYDHGTAMIAVGIRDLELQLEKLHVQLKAR